MTLVRITHDNDIAVVTIENPPVNALSQQVRQALWDAVELLDASPAISGVVLICAGRTFIAGADVKEFDKAPEPPQLPDLVTRIETARLPWLAAIHGAALGGGLEVALGCRFRIAAADASLGFPEVTLGLIPGASGTVRTPRLIGASSAVDLITSGKPIKAEAAKSIGLIDEIVTDELLASAIAFLRHALDRDLPPRLGEMPIKPLDEAYWSERREAIESRARGEHAQLRALACLKYATEHSFSEATAFERSTFLELRGLEQAAALRHVFFAERAATRRPDIAGVEAKIVEQASVVGGGTMGVGIAAALLEAGLSVVLVERDAQAIERASASMIDLLNRARQRGRLTEVQVAGRLAQCSFTSRHEDLAQAELVIEAVFEDLAAKREVFRQLDAVCRPDTIFATNTSYLDPRLIGEGISNPQRFIGLHFFSPANVMKLLEIVPLPRTDDHTLAASFALARRLGKVPVQAGICEGYIGNRILKRYRAGAEALFQRGILLAEIDAAMREYGFAMGPFEAQDLGGLDIAFAQRQAARASGQSVPETLSDLLVRADRRGQKTGGGWYDYAPGDRRPVHSMAAQRLLADSISGSEIMSRADIATYLVNQMADEGDLIVNEGIAHQSSDIDLVEIHGFGFPRWRGGPMFAKQWAATHLDPSSI